MPRGSEPAATVLIWLTCALPPIILETLPTTDRAWIGVVVPIPTFPLLATNNSLVPDDEATLNGFNVPVPCTLKLTVLDVAFTPTTIALLRKSAAEVMLEPEVKYAT